MTVFAIHMYSSHIFFSIAGWTLSSPQLEVWNLSRLMKISGTGKCGQSDSLSSRHETVTTPTLRSIPVLLSVRCLDKSYILGSLLFSTAASRNGKTSALVSRPRLLKRLYRHAGPCKHVQESKAEHIRPLHHPAEDCYL